jgi:hypothetical protein
MVRGKDTTKINKIINVLLKYPEGVWIRRISKESKLAVSTVHFYIDSVLSDLIENIGAKDKKGKYFGLRIVKLRPKIRETIEKKGSKIVFNYLKMYNKI